MLKGKIIKGDIQAGTKLVENEIAAQFNISRTPVREAINRLKAEGLATANPRKSVIVEEFNDKDIGHICKLRAALEKLALESALENWTDTDTQFLKEAAEKAWVAYLEGKTEVSYEFDNMFHLYIAERSENKFLLSTLKGIIDYIQLSRYRGCITKEHVSTSMKEHMDIVSAFKEKSFDKIWDLLCRHIHRALKKE
ncbi:MAG: GntR family transcriptional regulator [Desulfobacteraceae bacterium]|nr:MAG: GntR family transcriptional regulator [Desulfobacteraceae bacterium]